MNICILLARTTFCDVTDGVENAVFKPNQCSCPDLVSLDLSVLVSCPILGQKLGGEKFKRQQWKEKYKEKMKNANPNYGTNKCFKCGEEGHWANKCTAQGRAAGKVRYPHLRLVQLQLGLSGLYPALWFKTA